VYISLCSYLCYENNTKKLKNAKFNLFTQQNYWTMALEYNEFGYLKPQIHPIDWGEFKELFGYNDHRRWLLEGMEIAICDLKTIGCQVFYADGSFITPEELPGDFDICWEDDGIDIRKAHAKCPALFDVGRKFERMKARYRGDVVPANHIADWDRGINYLGFFMEDRQGREKGIIRIDIP